ncbi:MAG: hypothetical protein WD018_06140 [Nitrosopumilaceae archaeon]
MHQIFYSLYEYGTVFVAKNKLIHFNEKCILSLWYDMKGISILVALAIVSGIVLSQEAFADSDPPTKDEKQFVSGLCLIGFVGIYGGVIYLRKSMEIKSTPK